MVRDDGLARDREQGLGDVEGERAEAGTARGTADEDDGLGMHYYEGRRGGWRSDEMMREERRKRRMNERNERTQ